MWGFRQEDAYKMMDVEINKFYPPAPIYKGYAVFKILEIRKADLEQYKGREEYYHNKIKSIKKYELFTEWAKEFKASANIKNLMK